MKRYIRVITYSEFTEYTGHIFFELKLIKVKDIFSLTKVRFMFNFIKLMTVFVINRSIHSYVIPHTKAKMSRFGLNTLHYDGANLLK